MKNNKRIILDMDGTIADLYSENEWLDRLLNEERGLFLNLKPLPFLKEMQQVFKGHDIVISTWTPKNVSKDYINIVAQEKREWLRKNGLCDVVSKIDILNYGTNKTVSTCKKRLNILFDDNEQVLKDFTGVGLLPTKDNIKLIEYL